MTQGSRSPGLPVPGAETTRNRHRRPVDITFTKWITTSPLMEGFTGGAGKHSFTALIRGGTSRDTGAAQLDGVILFGWRTGARVQVEFQTMPAPSPTESGCDGAPPGINCFQGTIHIE